MPSGKGKSTKSSYPVEKTYKDRVYVTVAEMARRLDVSKPSILYHAKEGHITIETLPDSKLKWVDWERYKNIRQQLKVKEKARKSKNKTSSSAKPRTSCRKKIEMETVGDENIRDIPAVEVDEDGDKYTLYRLDPKSFSDCWIDDGNGRYLKDPEGNPLLDNRLVDIKLKALIHNQQLQQQAGELLSRHTVEVMIGNILIPFKTKITQIPQRYFSRVAAVIEKRKGIKLDSADRLELRKVMNDETNSILKALQTAIRTSLENEAQDEK